MRFFAYIILSICILMGCDHADKPDFSTTIDALFTAYDQDDRPGYGIGIIKDGNLIYANGFGVEDLKTKKPITSKTAFNIASLSKQFTAAMIAFDIQTGHLSLDDKLEQHWDDLPPFMKEIDIAHLVYMTSGLPEYYSLPSPRGGWASENQFTIDDAISAVMSSDALDYAPGTRWSYSNINYQLLSKITSRNHQGEYGEIVDHKIFKPLGMHDSWVDAPIQFDRKNRVTSHTFENGAWQAAPRLSPHYGGSGIFSSVEDLAKWDIALYSKKVFGEDFTSLMLSTKTFDHDKTNDAFGLVHGEYLGQPTIWYEGGDYGASAYMVRLPNRNETVICLSNFANAGCVAKARAVIDVLMTYK